jgi:hypothetical protein
MNFLKNLFAKKSVQIGTAVVVTAVVTWVALRFGFYRTSVILGQEVQVGASKDEVKAMLAEAKARREAAKATAKAAKPATQGVVVQPQQGAFGGS